MESWIGIGEGRTKGPLCNAIFFINVITWIAEEERATDGLLFVPSFLERSYSKVSHLVKLLRHLHQAGHVVTSFLRGTGPGTGCIIPDQAWLWCLTLLVIASSFLRSDQDGVHMANADDQGRRRDIALVDHWEYRGRSLLPCESRTTDDGDGICDRISRSVSKPSSSLHATWSW